MPISGNSPSTREECACARPFDATQWRHQLLYTACPVNSCSAAPLPLHHPHRLALDLALLLLLLELLNLELLLLLLDLLDLDSWSYKFGPGRQPPEERLSESSDSGIASVLFPVGFHTLFSLYATVQPWYCEPLISFWIHASIFFATFEPLWNM